ncbi:MAG: tRNA lysidine(34) synthetase TilS [Polyangia bacterium]
MHNAPPPELPALLRRSAVLQAVRARWQELAENALLIKEGKARVLIACSGGPDSTALLLALWALREPLRLELTVACVDHQLRPESADEAAAVCQVAQRLGLPCERIAVEVPPGPSRAARARQVRYEALAQAAARTGCDALAVGHNRDDQSETVLMRWLGGSGLRGLVGMSACRPLRPGPGCDEPPLLLVRPLLAVPRAAIDDLLALAREHVRPLPFQDPTNASPRYQRSRLRHQLLPLLRREQPRLDAHLSELSEQLRADAECLDELADAALRRLTLHKQVDGEPLVTLPVRELQALPRALFARVVQRAAGGGLGQAHLDALWRLCRTTHGSQSLELPQRRAERRYDRLLLARRTERPRDPGSEELFLSEPGELVLPAGGLRVRLGWRRRDELSSAAPWLAVDPSELPLCVRPARRGERIGLGPAHAGHRKISDVLIDRKVPRGERPHVRVLASRDRVLWLLGTQGLLRTSRPPPAQAPVGVDEGRLLVVELLQP